MQIISRKSQIAIFTMIGLILLIGIAFIIYLRNGSIDKSELEKVSKLSLEFKPIQSYTGSCILQQKPKIEPKSKENYFTYVLVLAIVAVAILMLYLYKKHKRIR